MFAIYNNNGFIENKGGPAGYLFYLNEGFKKLNINVKILHDFDDRKTNNNICKKKLFKNEFFEEIKSILHFYKLGFEIKKGVNNFNDFKIIHVMSSEDAYYLKKICRFKGKLILTSHKPESLACEKISGINLRNGKRWNCTLLKKFFNYIEKYSYRVCDGFVFPSQNAAKIYYNFPGFSKYSVNKPIKYVYTGCSKKNITINSSDYRRKINLTDNDYVISYIGRHNEIKGYDLLTSIAEQLNKNNIFVVCAGSTSNLNYPQIPSWIELGYVSDVQNLINASDLIVVPNRSIMVP